MPILNIDLEWVWCFCSLTAVILTLESACFLAKASFTLTPGNIATLSATYWNYSSGQCLALIRQCANGRTGIFLLLTGFALQLLAMTTGIAVEKYSMHASATIYAAITGLGAFVCGYLYATVTVRRLRPKVQEHLRQMGLLQKE